MFFKFSVGIFVAIFMIATAQPGHAEPIKIISSCKAMYQEYKDWDEYRKSFAYTYQGGEASCGFDLDDDSALQKCEETRRDNNYLSYYSKTLLPPCKIYAESPSKKTGGVIWDEASFQAASQKFMAARAAKRKAGDLKTILQELPLFMYREKLRQYVIDREEDTHWAIASTPRKCPSQTYITWRGPDLDAAKKRALGKCDASLAKRYPDWAKYSNNECTCQLVMTDGKLVAPKKKIPGLLTTVVTMLFEQGEQSVVLRGMLEFEIGKLKPQLLRLLNPDGNLICGGKMNPSLNDDGTFSASCKALGFNAKGITQIITSGKTHSFGSGKTDQGGRFIFVTNLMPDEAAEKYPDYFGQK